MIRSAIRFLDGLFYEQATTTTFTRVLHSDPMVCAMIRAAHESLGAPLDGTYNMWPEYGHKMDFSDCSLSNGIKSALRKTDDGADPSQVQMVVGDFDFAFTLGDGKVIPIPQIVRTMPSIDMLDIENYRYFPLKEPTSILVCLTSKDKVFSTSFGGAAWSTISDLGWDETTVPSRLKELAEHCSNEDHAVADSRYEDMHISSVIGEDWLYFHVTADETSDDPKEIFIAIDEPADEDLSSDDEQVAVYACTIARAILIAMVKCGHRIDRYEEHALRSNILTLLLVDRG